MIKKIFKNKMKQENKKTIEQMARGKYIQMNYDKPNTPNTPDGLWFITLNPNCYVDEIKLESDLYFILKLYYHWRYGNKWNKLKDKQFSFNGIIEKQQGNNHIHIIMFCFNIRELAIFWTYLRKQFKQIYPKSSMRCSRIWNKTEVEEYINPFNKKKKRTADSIILLN